ncbi:extracellular matrix protein 1 isoform X2 [Oryzias latipes]|uniref:extracellular matrix protein 1 isoform X2 n=1 Tax=Oryzias latipes TaxID=8090 RepID=UPI0005CC6799|nr:extracellular matrix protein 1 isoform X2 [Oryzias latipes]
MQSAAVLLSALIPAELPAGPTRSPQEWAPLGFCSAPSLCAWFCGAQLSKCKISASLSSVPSHFSLKKKIDMNFPLGQPTADNIESLCRRWRQRPFYSSKCLQRSGHEFAARQAKSINSLDKEFRQCCTTSDHKLNYASQKWREEVEKFCLVEKKHTSFGCCSGDDPSVWSACFKSMSPDPHYNNSVHEAPSFSELCENTTSLLNSIPTKSRLRTFLRECCTVPVPLKTISITKFSEMSQDACLIGEPPSPDVKLCCSLMHEVAEETNVRQKRKICPVPSKPPMSLAFV